MPGTLIGSPFNDSAHSISSINLVLFLLLLEVSMAIMFFWLFSSCSYDYFRTTLASASNKIIFGVRNYYSKARDLLVRKFQMFIERYNRSVSVFASCFCSGLAILMCWAEKNTKNKIKWNENNLQNPDISLNIGIVFKNGSCPVDFGWPVDSNMFVPIFKYGPLLALIYRAIQT